MFIHKRLIENQNRTMYFPYTFMIPQPIKPLGYLTINF